MQTDSTDISRNSATGPEGLAWHAATEQDVLSRLETASNGLTAAEAAERLRRFGPNTLLRKGSDGPWLILWRQFNNPIGWLLIAAGALALALKKPTDAAVVFGAVGINAIIGFIQEWARWCYRSSHWTNCSETTGVTARNGEKNTDLGVRMRRRAQMV